MDRTKLILGTVSLTLAATGAEASGRATEVDQGSKAVSRAVLEIVGDKCAVVRKALSAQGSADKKDFAVPQAQDPRTGRMRTAAAFAQFPNHFSQDRPGPFSNFSRPKRLKAPPKHRGYRSSVEPVEPQDIFSAFQKFRPV